MRIDFSQTLTDVFGDPIPESYADVAVESRSFLVCERCGSGTPHHEMRQRPLTLGSVCVTSLISGSKVGDMPDDDVLRDLEMARRIVGPKKGTWSVVDFSDPTELARLQESVRRAPQHWAKSVRAAVIEALKV